MWQSTWSENDIQYAISLLKEGKNFKEISNLLGKSQNAVTKKLHRLGFKCESNNRTARISFEGYKKMDWIKIQQFYENSTYRGIQKKFNLTPQAIHWAVNNNQLILRTKKEAAEKRKIAGEYPKTKKSGIEAYRQNCSFKFSLNDYPNEFDFNLIKKHGWYSPSNKGNNLKGVSRDHMYSVREGFDNKVDPSIISHPANCRLILHIDNQSKRTKSCIALDELKIRINNWNIKYGKEEK